LILKLFLKSSNERKVFSIALESVGAEEKDVVGLEAGARLVQNKEWFMCPASEGHKFQRKLKPTRQDTVTYHRH
jgi:hypothetical protein